MYSYDRILLALFAALVISLAVTPLVRELARRRSLLDLPNHRSSHTIPVPRLGGVSIAIASLAGAAILGGVGSWRTALVIAAAAMMALVGVIDDLKSISTIQKYTPQLASAIVAAVVIQPTFDVATPFFQFEISGALAMALAVFWITAFINAFNFMDGVDGISGGVGVVTALALIFATSTNATVLLLPLAGALAGFLLWNVHPASIFMGDGGSQFVGFLLAAGALYWPDGHVNFLVMLIVFAPFLFDTGFTLVWRLWNRMEVFRAHRTHLYQRLNSAGLVHRDVANLYIGAAALCGIIAFAYRNVGVLGQTLLILALVLIAYVYVSFVTRLEDEKRGVEPGSAGARQSIGRTSVKKSLFAGLQKPANVRKEGPVK